jgi:NAD(P)H dehydrogenase (quinone)
LGAPQARQHVAEGCPLAAAELEKVSSIEVVRGARDPRTVARWNDEGRAAVRIDLDDPRSFPAALAGVDRIFLMTGYTIHTVHQMKTITDAAVDAGVSFVVHIGGVGVCGRRRHARYLAGVAPS